MGKLDLRESNKRNNNEDNNDVKRVLLNLIGNYLILIGKYRLIGGGSLLMVMLILVKLCNA